MDIDGIKLIEENDKVLKAHRERKGGFEPLTRQYVQSHDYGKLGIFVDVGSYTGFYSFLALKHGARDCIFIEPHPLNYNRILRNIELNGLEFGVELHGGHIAFSDKEERVELRGKAGLTSAGSILGDEPIICEVYCYRADKWLTYFPENSLVKIDVEGAEVSVLEGFGDLLYTKNTTFLIEVLGDTRAVDSILLPLGYVKEELDVTMYKYSNTGS